MNVLVIEDDTKILELLEIGLKESGYQVDLADNGNSGWEKLKTHKYDVVILDVVLPGMDGLTILSQMRATNILTPVLILSANKSLDDRVNGLESGGDDYLVKPFAFAELIARLHAITRRAPQALTVPETKLTYEDVEIDLETREVKRQGQKFALQVREYALMVYFMQNPGKVLTKSLILEKVWGYDFDPQTNVVDVLVCRLRNKIDKDFKDKIIQTHRGVGYVLKKD